MKLPFVIVISFHVLYPNSSVFRSMYMKISMVSYITPRPHLWDPAVLFLHSTWEQEVLDDVIFFPSIDSDIALSKVTFLSRCYHLLAESRDTKIGISADKL